MYTVLVANPDLTTRLALRQTLTEGGYGVVLVASGEEALQMLSSDPPSVLVLDVKLPGMNGIEVCRELREWCSAPVIFLSSSSQPDDKVHALDAGADDYMTTPFEPTELTARIRSHLRRASERPASGPVLEMGELRLDLARRQFFRSGEEVRLTRKEFALLQYLMQNAGRIVNYRVLLSQVWGPRHPEDVQLLRVHIGNLRRKIERDPQNPRYIITELGVGYRFKSPVERELSVS
jgi:two-component system KDP operon response regulator KdpE